MKPYYKHDCNGCVYLGSITFPSPRRAGGKDWMVDKRADLYVCGLRDSLGPTVIARMGSRPADYASCPASLTPGEPAPDMNGKLGYSSSGPALATAKLFAQVKGLVKPEQKRDETRARRVSW